MSRCYGNPVPRRNAADNSTDMNSFPFVRHHFLRAGFEVVDCPPLTAQLKNSADIRMVMDVRDMLTHETRFDEFILLSGDADFTPVLHRLRAHARGTVVFANDHTAQPYTAISDGEIREVDLVSLLLEGRIGVERPGGELNAAPSAAELEAMRKTIVAEVAGAVRTAQQPVPLEALADRAVRALGHDKTVGSGWGGAGSFRDLLLRWLPDGVRLTEQPPYFAYEPTRHVARELEARPEVRTEQRVEQRPVQRERRPELDPRFEPVLEPEPGRRLEARPSYGSDPRSEPRFDAQPERERMSPAADPRFAPLRDHRDVAMRETLDHADRRSEPAPRQPEAQPQPGGYAQPGFFAPPDRPQIGGPVQRGPLHDPRAAQPQAAPSFEARPQQSAPPQPADQAS